MKISDYFPDIYNKNLQFINIANSEEKEFENLKDKIRQSFDNTFIITSNSNGLQNFENLMNIFPDLENEDLEFRRNRLFIRLQTKPPFTEKFMQRKLDDIMGANNWRYEIIYNDYTLDIYALHPGKQWYNELFHLLETIVPCNILWTIHIYNIIWQVVLDNTTSWNDLKEKNLTWEEVMEGEWVEDVTI